MASEQQSQVDGLYFEGGKAGPCWTRFSMLLTIAVIIATVGLYRNSGAVVIAAMLIAPLMTPILGIASAMVMGWTGASAFITAGAAADFPFPHVVPQVAFTQVVM